MLTSKLSDLKSRYELTDKRSPILDKDIYKADIITKPQRVAKSGPFQFLTL